MNTLFKISLLTLSIISISGCGGSGSSSSNTNPSPTPNKPDPTQPDPDPTEPDPSTGNCQLSYDNWKKLKIDDGLSTVESILGCSGEKDSDTSVTPGVVESNYLWGDFSKGPAIQVSFTNNNLSTKTFKPVSQPTPSCFPTGEAINTLKVGQERAAIEKMIGCAGAHFQSVAVNDDNIESNYTWGTAATQFLSLGFNNDVLDAISFSATDSPISKCEPTQEQWMSLNIGDDYQTVKNKLGCEGVLHSFTDVGGQPQINYIWGEIPNTSMHSITFADNQLISKGYTPKYGAVSSCNIDIAQWPTLPLNASYEQIKQAVGCDGILQNATSVSQGNTHLSYIWGNATQTMSSFTFENDHLTTKSFSNSEASSTCEPTQQQFDQVQVDQSLTQASSFFSCAGVLQRMTEVAAGEINKNYTWGKPVTSNYVSISTLNDIVTTKSFLPK